ncbi:hypothetical protein [Paludifilum halophilum]|uniref:hypothetical protein n=1 Tax=Paludifilum halophilum TaxID=1642702 RepID=UPI00146EC293|nr:hypothetical protein [Paludifilum halophilum]
MINQWIRALTGKGQVRQIRSHVQRPLQHKGIYNYQEYMAFRLAEARKVWREEEQLQGA